MSLSSYFSVKWWGQSIQASSLHFFPFSHLSQWVQSSGNDPQYHTDDKVSQGLDTLLSREEDVATVLALMWSDKNLIVKSSFLLHVVHLASSFSTSRTRQYHSSVCLFPCCVFNKDLLIYLCIWMFSWTYVCVLHACLVPGKVRRGWWIPWNWCYRWLWVILQVLGSENGSSWRAASVLNHWSISPSPSALV